MSYEETLVQSETLWLGLVSGKLGRVACFGDLYVIFAGRVFYC